MEADNTPSGKEGTQQPRLLPPIEPGALEKWMENSAKTIINRPWQTLMGAAPLGRCVDGSPS